MQGFKQIVSKGKLLIFKKYFIKIFFTIIESKILILV